MTKTKTQTPEQFAQTSLAFRIRGLEMGIHTFEGRLRTGIKIMSEAIYQLRIDMSEIETLISKRGAHPTPPQLRVMDRAGEVIQITKAWKSYYPVPQTKPYWSKLRKEIRENRKTHDQEKFLLYGIIEYKLKGFSIDALKHSRKHGKTDDVDLMLVTEFTYRTINALNSRKVYLFKCEKRMYVHSITESIRRLRKLGLEDLVSGLITVRDELAKLAY